MQFHLHALSSADREVGVFAKRFERLDMIMIVNWY